MKPSHPLQFLRLPFALSLAGLLLAIWGMVILLDPYLSWRAPVRLQLVNTALPMCLGLMLWRLSGRILLAFALVGIVFTVVLCINSIKTDLLGVNLIWADLRMAHSFAQAPQLILGFIQVPTAALWQIAAFALIGLAGLFILRDPPRPLSSRVGQSVLPALALLSWPYVDVSERAVNSLHWDMFNQVRNAPKTGVLGNVVLGGLATSNPLFAAQAETLNAFWGAPEILQVMAAPYSRYRNKARPDIIVILSESLFEPALLCGMKDQPVLKGLARMQPPRQDGLSVPVFGNRTLQSEFEVLSGTPLQYFPKSVFSYYDLLKHPIQALPSTLQEMGYVTHALHPNSASYWNRQTVFPQMGIGQFHQLTSFIRPDDYSTPWHVSDRRLMELATQLLSDDQDSFLFIATIANHGPWNFKPEKSFPVPASLNDDKVRDSLRDYIGRATAADQAITWLTQQLAKRKKPTLVVVFGDHMPALGKVFEQTCFKNGQPAEAQQTIVKFWANFPIDKREIPQQTASYLLPGHALRLAGLKVEGHLLANAMLGKAEVLHKTQFDALREAYSHVAADNLASIRRSMLPARQWLDSAAVTQLERGQSGGEPKPSGELALRFEQGELVMPVQTVGVRTKYEFPLNQVYSSVTLRPYIHVADGSEGSGAQCSARQLRQGWQLKLSTGERILFNGRIAPKDIKLLQLDLLGAETLNLEWLAPDTAKQCGTELRARVTHLVCAAAVCE